MGTALPGLSLQTQRDVTRHTPASGAGQERTLYPFPSPSCTSPHFAPCAQACGSIWASVVGHVLESHKKRVGGHSRSSAGLAFVLKATDPL